MQPRLRYWARHLYGTQPYLQIANLFTRVAREVVLTVMSIENLLTNDNLQTIYRKLQRTPTIAIAWIRPLSSIASCLSIPKIFLELPRNFIEYFEVTQRSLRVFYVGSPDKPRGLSIQPCKSEKEEPYIRHSSQGRSECLYLRIE